MQRKQVCVVDETPLPLSRVVRAGDLVFVSGHVAYDHAAKKAKFAGIKEQTEAVLSDIAKMLSQCGGGLEDVVKTTVYLSEEADFSAMNEVYARFFPKEPPARSTVIVKLAVDVLIEIEAIAYIPVGR